MMVPHMKDLFLAQLPYIRGWDAARTAALVAPLALAIVLVGLGALQAAQVLTGGPAPRLALSPANQDAFGRARPIDGLYAVGQAVPTRFGVVAVQYADKLAGLSAKDLAGVTHGIQNLIRPDQVQVQVQGAVELTNLRPHPGWPTPPPRSASSPPGAARRWRSSPRACGPTRCSPRRVSTAR